MVQFRHRRLFSPYKPLENPTRGTIGISRVLNMYENYPFWATFFREPGVKTIFHPCVFFAQQETDGAQNHYNCPIMVSYAENLKNNPVFLMIRSSK